jgi:hypothetical protein
MIAAKKSRFRFETSGAGSAASFVSVSIGQFGP